MSTNGVNGTSHPFRIAIVGGAIGGLTTALFIDKFCGSLPTTKIQVDVYEQAAEYREIGAGVGLGYNAAKLIHKVDGLGEKMNGINSLRNDVWFHFVRWNTGENIVTIPAPVPSEEEARLGDKAVRPTSLHRSEFLDVLLEAVKEKNAATLHTKKRLRRLEDKGSKVELQFEDGTNMEADMVVAADGIHSAIRRQLTTGHALYSGKIAYRGIVPVSDLPKKWPGTPGNYESVMWLGKGKHFLVFPISSNKSMNIVAFITKREDEIPDLKESWTSTCPRKELEDDFGDCEETVRDTIALLPERVSKWRINDHEPIKQWAFMGGKVALVGDACHAMVPHQGAGAGQAVEDGYILAQALADYLKQDRHAPASHKLDEYVKLYQDVRLPRAQKVQNTSREAGELYEFELPMYEGKTYEECLPLLSEQLKTRMKWIWAGDIDDEYAKLKTARGVVSVAA